MLRGKQLFLFAGRSDRSRHRDHARPIQPYGDARKERPNQPYSHLCAAAWLQPKHHLCLLWSASTIQLQF